MILGGRLPIAGRRPVSVMTRETLKSARAAAFTPCLIVADANRPAAVGRSETGTVSAEGALGMRNRDGGMTQRSTRGWAIWGACAVATVVAPASLHAQSLYSRDANTAVSGRAHPEYDAVGVHVGSFTAYPKISLTGTYDDNIFGLPEKTSGFIASAVPSVDFVSNWSRNALEFNLRYERDEYADQPSESSNEYALSSTGRLDIDHASAATFRFNVADLTEARTSPDSFVGLREPVRYDLVTTGGTIYREFNRYRVDVDVSNSFYSFYNSRLLNGGLFNESSRDEDALSERIRGSWAESPNLAFFVQVAPNQSHFLHAPTNGFSSFDSSGYAVEAGVNGQVTHLVTADVGLGYYSQSYNDRRIPGVSGLAYNADIQYYPTQLITVYGRASHSISASGIPGTPATDLDSVDVKADYELLRNIIISPDANFARYKYPGTLRVDNRYGVGLSATYLVNRTIGLTAAYGYLRQDSNGQFGGISFDDNRLSLTVTLQR